MHSPNAASAILTALLVLACSGGEIAGQSTPEPPQESPSPEEPTDREPAETGSAAVAPIFDVAPWQTLLDTYVTSDGGVRYSALRENAEHRAALARLVDAVGSAEVSEGGRDARLAFFINAYNILTMHAVLERWPIESVMQSEGFFDAQAHRVAGVDRTLNQLEGDVIRGEEFGEPRIHFAVNCASVGCPPLAQRAYTAANLEEQLSRQTDAFVRGTSRIERGRERVSVSQLLEWYADDFGGPEGVRAFLVAHLEGEDAAFVRDPSTRIEHFPYDWSLNGR